MIIVAYIMPLSPKRLIKILVANADASIFAILLPNSNVPITFSLSFRRLLAFFIRLFFFSSH